MQESERLKGLLYPYNIFNDNFLLVGSLRDNFSNTYHFFELLQTIHNYLSIILR